MRILLFDWYSGGHHERYLSAFTRALAGRYEVVAAAPPAGAQAAAEAGAQTIVIHEPFPISDTSRRFSRARRSALKREVELLRGAVHTSAADHALHLFGDGMLRVLPFRSIGAPLSVLLFRPRHRLPEAAPRHRSPGERLIELAYEAAVTAWRLSPGAHAILTLDPLAAERWSRRPGAPAFALPEPPVYAAPPSAPERRGAVVFGALSARKGIGYLADAVELEGHGLELLLAGTVYEDYAPTLHALAERMRAAGAKVEVRPVSYDEAAGLAVLAGARVALLPYVGHVGMSRVLLEAAVAGTPVLAHEEGLVGHFVRTRDLGRTVDCRNATALAAAIHELINDPDGVARHAPALRAFVAEHGRERFANAVQEPFAPTLTKRPSNWRTRPVARS